ncbi:uncharacterized protein LOC111321391 [Stylophora pistillata]|uniref:Fibronectin type-III domain-containing protein n=1 Tax=Stylophora pistillata TaxID=50429 RepID=A0A2B4SU60_STYPI|nr:uncharacterized protein LOC111321391 [Stylophora pistillata]PFX32027.1 hypothetical protein AWC38_SpisGene3149 [Stylophora pistillata]
MLRSKFQSVLVSVVWVCFITRAQCFGNFHKEKSNRGLNDCEQRCQNYVSTEASMGNLQQSRRACLGKCRSSNEENSENARTTTSSPRTRSTSEFLNSVDSPTATNASENACPKGDQYAPRSDEIVPGEVTEVDVKFVQVKEGDSQEWVARVNWTRPKDVNITSKWRGYIVIWFSEDSDNSNQFAKVTNCKLVSKIKPRFNISETDGWKYPNTLYLTIVALPTHLQEFPLQDYTPLRAGWRGGKVYSPANYSKGHKSFKEKSFLVILAGALMGFSMILILYICLTRRKAYNGGKLLLTSKKKQEKREDELKNEAVVIQNPCSGVKHFL